MPDDRYRLRVNQHEISKADYAEAALMGRKMAALRRMKGVTATFVAARMGLKPAYLCDLEKGRRFWHTDRVAEYLKAIGETHEKVDTKSDRETRRPSPRARYSAG